MGGKRRVCSSSGGIIWDKEIGVLNDRSLESQQCRRSGAEKVYLVGLETSMKLKLYNSPFAL